MNRGLITGMALGAGLMYLLDPQTGDHRRSTLYRRIVKTVDTIDRSGKELPPRIEHFRGQVSDIVAEAQSHLSNTPITDDTLHDRIYARLNRFVSNPSGIEITVQEGRVTLHGTVITDGIDTLISHIKAMRGVVEVENHLTMSDQKTTEQKTKATNTIGEMTV